MVSQGACVRVCVCARTCDERRTEERREAVRDQDTAPTHEGLSSKRSQDRAGGGKPRRGGIPETQKGEIQEDMGRGVTPVSPQKLVTQEQPACPSVSKSQVWPPSPEHP